MDSLKAIFSRKPRGVGIELTPEKVNLARLKKQETSLKLEALASVELPEGVEMVMPGDNIKMTIELIVPIAMEEGLRFAIREGGRTVGAGVVSKILK